RATMVVTETWGKSEAQAEWCGAGTADGHRNAMGVEGMGSPRRGIVVGGGAVVRLGRQEAVAAGSSGPGASWRNVARLCDSEPCRFLLLDRELMGREPGAFSVVR